ncbi:hypothetical protein L211DRAFT_870164 [Terfezia boudieri ATCC MYA-4762]|uniref:Uncharacterized protein n=1 Tax=Terfezia boudieri ATCC MYA-4762 TaxID=1051890 RepID=A0A3N4LE89_9PEZI|nr:hypothetical protein L211DRAFT_870164 [Terfezia boudieri ATCC MYA-4762]
MGFPDDNLWYHLYSNVRCTNCYRLYRESQLWYIEAHHRGRNSRVTTGYFDNGGGRDTDTSTHANSYKYPDHTSDPETEAVHQQRLHQYGPASNTHVCRGSNHHYLTIIASTTKGGQGQSTCESDTTPDYPPRTKQNPPSTRVQVVVLQDNPIGSITQGSWAVYKLFYGLVWPF